MFRRRRARLDDEVTSHLAEETADNIARGMDPAAARYAALRTFGNVEAAKERARELNPWYWLDTLWQDVRFALRLITRNRWTSAAILATLTAGIALNVTVFTLLNALLLRPWVRTQPETFVTVIPRFSGEYRLRYSDGGLSQPDYAWFRDSARSLESLAAFRFLSVTLSGEESGTLRGGLISCNLFDVMRPGPPVLGRYLTADECTTPLQPAVAILSETAWRTRFNADPGISGRIIHLNRMPFTVVGVAPAVALSGPAEGDVWMPFTMLGALRPADDYFSDRGAQWLSVVGRRHPDYSLRQLQEELDLLARAADEKMPGRVTSLIVTNGSLVQHPDMRSRASLLIGVTLGTTTLLLLLACVNVTTLLLSRAAARQREIAVRLSLGAGRFRLLRQLLTESLVLSGLAAALSVFIAQRAPAALWKSVMSSAAPFDLSPDWRVLLYCLCVAVGAGIIAGASPALESLRPGMADSLKRSTTAVTQGPRRSRLRGVLVAVQVALSLLLLVEAALFARAQRRFLSYDPGFETTNVVSVRLESVRAGYDPPPSFYREFESRVRAVPGVVTISYTSPAPWDGRSSSGVTEIDGKPLPDTRDFRRDPARREVSAEFFHVLDIPLTRGRPFRDHERSAAAVIPTIVSEAMARRYWPGQDPVGHQFRTSAGRGRTPWRHDVIGVARDVQSVRSMQDDGPLFYGPLDIEQSNPSVMLIRVSSDPEAVATAIRNVVRLADQQMASTVVTLASIVEAEGERLQPAMMYGAFAGALALFLALTGVYGVVSFSVTQRIREIGIRVALGAQRRDVLSIVLRSGAAPVLGGLVAGLGLALAVSFVMEAILFGLSPRDPLTFAGAALLLFAAALGAIWLPARRAAALDPVTSLRYE